MPTPSLFEEELELAAEPNFEPVIEENDDDGYENDEDENSPLTRYPIARRRPFQQWPNDPDWGPGIVHAVTFDTMNFRSEADKYSAVADIPTGLCFILVEPYRKGDEPYRMLMNHPDFIEFSHSAFRIFTAHDHELEVRYTRSTKYIAVHDQNDSSASIWLQWDGTLIEAQSDPNLATELARVLCCLNLLTKETERALAVSVRAADKRTWIKEFKRRERNVY